MAMKNYKTSWLSREAIALGAFTGLASVVAALYFFEVGGFTLLFVEAITLAIGSLRYLRTVDDIPYQSTSKLEQKSYDQKVLRFRIHRLFTHRHYPTHSQWFTRCHGTTSHYPTRRYATSPSHTRRGDVLPSPRQRRPTLLPIQQKPYPASRTFWYSKESLESTLWQCLP